MAGKNLGWWTLVKTPGVGVFHKAGAIEWIVTRTMAMQREEVMRKLRTALADLRQQNGVASLALFGSVARDEAGPESDVDLLVEFYRPVTLFDLVAVQQHLERCLGVKRVDLVPRDSFYPAFRLPIMEDAVDVS